MEKISTQLKGDSRGLGIFFGRCLVGKKGDVQRKRRRMHNHTSNNAWLSSGAFLEPETLSQFQTRSGFIISASLDAFRFIKGYPSIQLHPAAHVPHGRAWPPQSYALPNIPSTTKLPSGYLFSEITRSDANKLIALNWMTRLRRIQKWRSGLHKAVVLFLQNL